MAGAVVNYPLVAGLIAFAIAQSTKFFTTWQAAVWNILGLVLLRGSQIQGYMTRRTSMFSQCQKLIRYVRGATNRCNRLIGKKQIKGEAKRLDYILLCVWRGLRRHQPLFRGSFHQEEREQEGEEGAPVVRGLAS